VLNPVHIPLFGFPQSILLTVAFGKDYILALINWKETDCDVDKINRMDKKQDKQDRFAAG
jgi:hypothetical protein